jgi:hypothetical protein
MSSKPKRATKNKVEKTVSLETADFSVDSSVEDSPPVEKKSRRKAVAATKEDHGAKIYNRLLVVIDVLEAGSNNGGYDEQTMRSNVPVALKHLKELLQMLS